MSKLNFAICVGALCLAARGVEYSWIDVDVSSLPKERQFLRGVVLSRVWNRTLPSDDSRKLKVTFAMDASIRGEDAIVKVANGVAEIRGGRFRSLVFGAGTLLRAIRYGEKSFSLEDGEYRFSPANPYRIAYFARHFNNWYFRASADELVPANSAPTVT